MAINSLENVTKYSSELDKMFAQKSAVGFFADNALATKFVGAKTVIIPDIDFAVIFPVAYPFSIITLLVRISLFKLSSFVK